MIAIGKKVGDKTVWLRRRGQKLLFSDREAALKYLLDKMAITEEQSKEMVFDENPSTIVLFTNDWNGLAKTDPHAFLIKFDLPIGTSELIEHKPIGRFFEKALKEMLKEINISYQVLDQGLKSEFKESDYDFEYEINLTEE